MCIILAPSKNTLMWLLSLSDLDSMPLDRTGKEACQLMWVLWLNEVKMSEGILHRAASPIAKPNKEAERSNAICSNVEYLELYSNPIFQ